MMHCLAWCSVHSFMASLCSGELTQLLQELLLSLEHRQAHLGGGGLDIEGS